MPESVTGLLYSFFHGYGGILLVVGTVLSFIATFIADRLSLPLWVLAVGLNLTTIRYLTNTSPDYEILLMFLVRGYGLGGLGFGWLLGILLCWTYWQIAGRRGPRISN